MVNFLNTSGTETSKLSIKIKPDGNQRGVFATEELKKGDQALFMPRNTIITPRDARTLSKFGK